MRWGYTHTYDALDRLCVCHLKSAKLMLILTARILDWPVATSRGEQMFMFITQKRNLLVWCCPFKITLGHTHKQKPERKVGEKVNEYNTLRNIFNVKQLSSHSINQPLN